MGDLRVLADLRARAEIRVLVVGDRAWVRWQGDAALTSEILPGRILPLEGVELFCERAGGWYRLREHLPALGVPFRTDEEGVGLDRLLIPAKLSAQRTSGSLPERLRIGMVRDEGQGIRLATAVRCSLKAIFLWAEETTSQEISRLRGAWWHGAAGGQEEGEVFVFGEPGSLPHLVDSVRYWGTDLLVPLGFRSDPDLPSEAIRSAAGAGAGDLLVIDEHGIELIDLEAFEPLSRAGIRLAYGGALEKKPPGGGER